MKLFVFFIILGVCTRGDMCCSDFSLPKPKRSVIAN